MPEPAYLYDTNILLRLSRRDDPDYSVVRNALQNLQRRGATFCYTSQNLVEFWNVARARKTAMVLVSRSPELIARRG